MREARQESRVLRILVATRGNEIRNIKSVLDALDKKHEVAILETQKAAHPFWFNFIYASEEYHFYKTLPQGSYWKERIFNVPFAFPKWLRWSFLRHLKRCYVPPESIVRHLKQLSPDIVLATNLMFVPHWEDYDYALAAKQLGIPLIGFVPAWDTLTTKTKIQVMPDLIFCWNENHKQELVKYHKVAENIISIVGSYKFEQWFSRQLPQRKDKFCARYKLNPNQPILTYLCSSPAIEPNEEGYIIEWANHYKDYQIIIKPHPDKPLELKNLRVPNPQAIVIHDPRESVNCYAHSAAVYGISTSAFIECLLVGTPVYATLNGEHEKQLNCLHFQQLQSLLNGNGVKEIKTWLGVQEQLPSLLVLKSIEVMLKQKKWQKNLF